MYKLLFLALVLVGYATADCVITNDVQLEVLCLILKYFPSTTLDERSYATKTWTDSTGCNFISFITPLQPNDKPFYLCQNMSDYINQENWLNGSTAKCNVGVDSVELLLIGKSDPNYQPDAPSRWSSCKPLQVMGFILNYYKRAQLGQCWCTPVVDSNARPVNIKFGIETGSLTCQACCDSAVNYFSQDPSLLDKSTNSCSVTDSGCVLEFRGDA